jgi:uncharacterized protein YwgA
MKNSRLFPVVLMYVEGTGVEGATRMQKLVFIAQEETELPEAFEYEAGPYGPYSWELERALDQLAGKDVVDINHITNEVGNEKTVYSLTDIGIRVGKKMVESEDIKPFLDIAVNIKDEFGDRRMKDLLDYVYTKYPGLTTETELDTDRLHDPDSRSQFLEPGSKHGETKFIGPGPKEGHNMRSSAKELFSVE